MTIIYRDFWVNVDVPENYSRLHLYEAQIIDFKCYIEKISKGDGKRSRLYVKLVGEGELDFRLSHKTCHFVNSMVPKPSRKMFSGYFDGAIVMQLKIGNKEVINFIEEKERSNIFALYLVVSPLICYLYVRYVKYRQSKKLK